MMRIFNVKSLPATFIFYGALSGLIAGGLTISAPASGQTGDPEKLRIKNNDLRGQKTIFSVEGHLDELNSVVLLETGNDQFMMDFSGNLSGSGTDTGSRRKISSAFARQADEKFVKEFIRLKYQMKKGGQECFNIYTLELRGEKTKVCRHEKEKVGVVTSLVKDLMEKLKVKK